MSRDNLLKARKILIEYMKVKMELEDWHGVSDAANDLRELDASIGYLIECEKEESELLSRYFQP